MKTIQTPIEQLKAVAHPLRFHILEAMQEGELNVSEIEKRTGIGQPTLSQQLGILRKAELVKTRKEAKMVFYCLDNEQLDALGNSITMLGRRGDERGGARRKSMPGAANFARLS